MQNKIDSLYNDNNDVDNSMNDLKIDNQNQFLNQFEFKEPTLKRKRNDIANNVKKSKKELKKQSLELKKTKESMKLASSNFHKSLNMVKDSLELEML